MHARVIACQMVDLPWQLNVVHVDVAAMHPHGMTDLSQAALCHAAVIGQVLICTTLIQLGVL